MKVWVVLGATVAGIVMLAAIIAAVAGFQPSAAGAGYSPSTLAQGDIPPEYLALYQSAAATEGLDWTILAGIGWTETHHGQPTQCPTSSAGARGPMQFMPATWGIYGEGGDICDPTDAIPAAARLLKASGAPADYHRAILAYNHSEQYVADVLRQAQLYRGQTVAQAVPLDGSVRARIVAMAKATLTTRTGYLYYSENGTTTEDPMPPPPARSDCSSWARAIYLAAGAPDPGVNTWDQVAHGHQSLDPQPGDLMFPPDPTHVEIYIGGGRTIGHGDAQINYGSVSSYPHAFYMSYLP